MHSWVNILLEMSKFQDIPFTKSIGVKMFLIVTYLYLKILLYFKFSVYFFSGRTKQKELQE
jgi:hypothetical protein